MRRPFLEITNDLSTVSEGDENLSGDASGAFSTPRTKILPLKKTRMSDVPQESTENQSANTSSVLSVLKSELSSNETGYNIFPQEGDENLTAYVSGAFSPIKFNAPEPEGNGTGSFLLQQTSALEMSKGTMEMSEQDTIPWSTFTDPPSMLSSSASKVLIPEGNGTESSLLQQSSALEVSKEAMENSEQDTIPWGALTDSSSMLSTSKWEVTTTEGNRTESFLLRQSRNLETDQEMPEESEQNNTPWNLSTNISVMDPTSTCDVPVVGKTEQGSTLIQLNNSLKVDQEMSKNLEQDTTPLNTSADPSGVLSTSKCEVTTTEGNGMESSLLEHTGLEMNQEMSKNLEHGYIPWNMPTDISVMESILAPKVPMSEGDETKGSLMQLDNSLKTDKEMTQNLEQDSTNVSSVVFNSETKISMTEKSTMESSMPQVNEQEMSKKFEQGFVPWNMSTDISAMESNFASMPQEEQIQSSLLQLDGSLKMDKEMTENLKQDIMESPVPGNLSAISTPTCVVPMPEEDGNNSVLLQEKNDMEMDKEMPKDLEQDIAQSKTHDLSSVDFTPNIEVLMTGNNQPEFSLLEQNDQEMTEDLKQENIPNYANISTVDSNLTCEMPTIEETEQESSLLQLNRSMQVDQEMSENLEKDATLLDAVVDSSSVLSTSKCEVMMGEGNEPESLLPELNSSLKVGQDMMENMEQETVPCDACADPSSVLSISVSQIPTSEGNETESLLQQNSNLEMSKGMMEKSEQDSIPWNGAGDSASVLSTSKIETSMVEDVEVGSSLLQQSHGLEMKKVMVDSEQSTLLSNVFVDSSNVVSTSKFEIFTTEENEMEASLPQFNGGLVVDQEMTENVENNTFSWNVPVTNLSGISTPPCMVPMTEEDEAESSLVQLDNCLEVTKGIVDKLEKGVNALNMTAANVSQMFPNQSNIFMSEKDELNFLLLEARCAHEATKELCDRLKQELTGMKCEFNETKDVANRLKMENFEAKKEIASLNATLLEGKKKFNQIRRDFNQKQNNFNDEIRKKEELYKKLEIEKNDLMLKGKKKLDELGEKNESLILVIEDLEKNLKNLENENQNLQEIKIENEKQLMEISEKLNMAEFKIEELEKTVNLVEEENKNFQELKLQGEKRLMEILEKLNMAEFKIEELEKIINVAEEEKQKFQELQMNGGKELMEISEKLNMAEFKIEELEKTVNLVEEENQKFRELKLQGEKRLMEISEKLNMAEFKVEELEKTVNTVEEENKNFRELKLQGEKRLMEISEKLKIAEFKVEELEKIANVAEEEKQKLNGLWSDMEKQMTMTSEKLKADEILIEELKRNLKVSEEEKIKLEELGLNGERQLKAMESRIQELEKAVHVAQEEKQNLESENEKQITEVSGKLKVAELRIISLEKKVKEYEETIDDLEETQRLNSDTIFSLTKQNTQLKEKLGMSGLRAIIEMDNSSHSVNEDKDQSFTSAKEFPSPKPAADTTMTDGKENTPNTPGRKPSFASKLASPFRKSKQQQNPNSTCNQQ